MKCPKCGMASMRRVEELVIGSVNYHYACPICGKTEMVYPHGPPPENIPDEPKRRSKSPGRPIGVSNGSQKRLREYIPTLYPDRFDRAKIMKDTDACRSTAIRVIKEYIAAGIIKPETCYKGTHGSRTTYVFKKKPKIKSLTF